MTEAVELQLPPDTQHVGLARLVVVTAARRAGMHEEQVEDLRIAVSEATTNAILVHQRATSDERVTLRFGETDDGAFEVTVMDAGGGEGAIDIGVVDDRPTDDAGQALEGWQPDGDLGVTLIRGLADDVEYLEEEGTRVRLRFTVTLPAPPS